ncbi:hypothetical protein [Candidatus Nitrosocosmicus sp. T]
MKLRTNKPFLITSVFLFAAAIVLASAMNSNNVVAQSTGGVNTFSAEGNIGTLALSPESLQSLNASQDTNLNFVLGGDWSFDVSNGQLQDFKVELNRHSLGGHEAETHVIDGLDNATAVTNTTGNDQITLTGNNTQFQGLANIETVETGKVWEDVPVLAYLINGHILNLSFDVSKTDGHFLNLPLIGVVTSLTEGSSNGQANSTAIQ